MANKNKPLNSSFKKYFLLTFTSSILIAACVGILALAINESKKSQDPTVPPAETYTGVITKKEFIEKHCVSMTECYEDTWYIYVDDYKYPITKEEYDRFFVGLEITMNYVNDLE